MEPLLDIEKEKKLADEWAAEEAKVGKLGIAQENALAKGYFWGRQALEEQMDKIQKAYTEIWKTQVYPVETKGKPKADDILKKAFPWLKAE